MEKSIHSRSKVVPALNRQTINTATSTYGPAIDLLGYESVEIGILTDTITAAGSGATVSLQESSTGAFGGEENAVAAAQQLGGSPVIDQDADDNKAFRLGYVGKKRYIRVKVVSLASFNGSLGALAFLSNPVNAPVADQNT